ncbi:related to Nucleoporin NUP170 [Saccharomycodes ludwigii]|uniref:Related to Nucleoporin NUP170 n=1 Tax=Saccharomycodes ludwigii TaxID=36035 RepID=A0A376B6Z4_9ASCO|nr:related to Nucleoporin NUP170 [Saccharomycodes ludwigii]
MPNENGTNGSSTETKVISNKLSTNGHSNTNNTAAAITNIAPLSNFFSNIMNTRNETVRIKGFNEKPPLELASQYIDNLNELDNNAPILDVNSYYNNGVEYNFSKDIGGLGAFTPFQRSQVINIPEELLKKTNSANTIDSNMGIFSEIDRCWITFDSKIVLWNMKQSGVFQTIDEFKAPIVKISLVKPRPCTFVNTITHLLIVATTQDLNLFAISYDSEEEELSVYNTELSIALNGLIVQDIVVYESTGQIFFTTKDDLNIWEFQYSNTDEWFNAKCSKICLTQSRLSNLVPTSMVNKLSTIFASSSKPEELIQLVIDQSRGIIYTLSNKSVIRAYGITSKNSLESPLISTPEDMKQRISVTSSWRAAILKNEYFKIVKIVPILNKENRNLFLVAITVGGCRLYFNGFINQHNSKKVGALLLESVKFPPVSQEVINQKINSELNTKGKLLPNNLSDSYNFMKYRLQRSSSVLLSTSAASTIISPGIFFCPVEKDAKDGDAKAHKLFVSVPDYGILKNYNKYLENAAFLDTNDEVRAIAPITPLFNATETPYGYCNEFATQYSIEPLQVAVLTDTTLEIYKYRTPDFVFEDLISGSNVLPFVLNYGQAEACSTALFCSCKFNRPESLRSSSLNFFLTGIPGIVDLKPVYKKTGLVSYLMSPAGRPSASASTMSTSSAFAPRTPVKNSITTTSTNSSAVHEETLSEYSMDDVVLSSRFYGIALLVARMTRNLWNKPVFEVFKNCKFDSSNNDKIVVNSVIDNQIISKFSVPRNRIEYYLSSIVVVDDFLNAHSDQLLYTTASLSQFKDKKEELANNAENIAVASMIRLIKSMKEALSFLLVLYDESEVDGFEGQYLAFKDIIKYLSLEVQTKLKDMNFKDLFSLSSLETKTLIRELSSSIINRNLMRGRSIDYITNALQERCGSFCSSDDVLGYRAIEHLKKAKEIGLRDLEALNYHLKNATALFERACDDISTANIKEAVDIMLELHYYPKAIEFLLNLANRFDKGKQAYQYVSDGRLEHDERKILYDKRMMVYDLVFEILVKLDNLDSSKVKNTDRLRNDSYNVVLKYDDKLFHYSLYDWLVSQNQEEKLLQIDTDYILPYLREKASSSLDICNLLWVYHSKRQNFYEAACILYSIAISDFDIKLAKRIEFLSRASGFCKGICPPSQRQQMISLSSDIREVFQVSEVQDEILLLVENDSRFLEGGDNIAIKKDLLKQLDGKILNVSDLFNDFAEPLEYYEICLLIFKISDFRVHEEIMLKWQQLFDSLKKEVCNSNNTSNDAINEDNRLQLVNLVSGVVTNIGKKIHTSDFVFPIGELIPLITELFYGSNDGEIVYSDEIIKPGFIVNIFLSCGVSYDKMYYVFKDLIQANGYVVGIYKREINWLIKKWYEEDRNLRDLVSYDQIRGLKDDYSVESDPIEKFIKTTGNCV